jgi:hypothetical protein
MPKSRNAEKWKLEGKKQALMELLEYRFRPPLPEDLAAAIARSTDPYQITRWMKEALGSTSWGQFRAIILPPPKKLWRSTVIEEWRMEARREVVMRVLKARVSRQIPKDLATRINAITDREEIGRWLELSATASSLEEFRTAVHD